MLTIVPIHGTNAASSQIVGTQWWQFSSDFEQQLRTKLKSDSLMVGWRPFVWTGKNSERARQSAAKSLANFLKPITAKQEERICLICHSHGGNVARYAVANLLSESEREKIELIIYIGTPFTNGSLKNWVRILLSSRTILLNGIVFILALLALASLFGGWDEGRALLFGVWKSIANFQIQLPGSIVLRGEHIVAASAAAGMSVYGFSQWASARSRRRLAKFLENYASEEGTSSFSRFRKHTKSKPLYSPPLITKEVVVYSRLDEAINALSRVKGQAMIKLSRGSVSTYTFSLILATLMSWWLIWINQDGRSIPSWFPGGSLSPVSNESTNSIAVIVSLLVFLAASPWINYVASFLITHVLNWALDRLGRSSAFGDDLVLQSINGVTQNPSMDAAEQWRPLPAKLDALMNERCSEELKRTAQMTREVLATYAFVEGVSPGDGMTSTLSWKELIHTSYFDFDEIVTFCAGAIMCTPQAAGQFADSDAAKYFYEIYHSIVPSVFLEHRSEDGEGSDANSSVLLSNSSASP